MATKFDMYSSRLLYQAWFVSILKWPDYKIQTGPCHREKSRDTLNAENLSLRSWVGHQYFRIYFCSSPPLFKSYLDELIRCIKGRRNSIHFAGGKGFWLTYKAAYSTLSERICSTGNTGHEISIVPYRFQLAPWQRKQWDDYTLCSAMHWY